MTMKRRSTTFFIAILMAMLTASAQETPLTHFMYLNPYQLRTDPSAELLYNGYVSVPAIGNLGIGLYNSSIRYKNLFETDDEGYPISLTANKFVNSLRPKNNYLHLDFDEALLGFGFRFSKKFFFTFDYRLRGNVNLTYSKDLFGFPLMGNLNYLGDDNPAKLSLGINSTVYQEISFGLRHQLTPKISWGAHAKLLFGAFNVNTRRLNATITTNEDDYSMFLQYEADARLASAIPLQLNLNNGNYEVTMADLEWSLLGNAFKNVGAGIDLGFRYKLTKRITLAASVLDLGFIHWKTSTQRISSAMADGGHYYQDGGFLFSGLTEDDIVQLTSDDGRAAFLDSLADYFPLNSEAISGYSTFINPRILIQGEFDLNKSNRLILLAQGTIVNHNFRPALTVAYNGHFFNVFDVCLSYTLARKSLGNLGVGLGFDVGPVNVFFTAHNIIPAIDWTRWSKITASAGVVVNWGHIRKYWDERKEQKNK